MTSRMTRHPLALAAALALAACSHKAEATKASGATPPPLPDDVRTVAAVASPSPAEPAAPGTATSGATAGAPAPETGPLALTGEFVSLVRSDLVPRTGGRVGRVLVDEGRAVSKGQPLLELETDYLRLDLARAEADMKRADAAALDARRDLDRKTGLAQKGSVAQSTFDRSQSAADQAAAAQAAARANLDLARQRHRRRGAALAGRRGRGRAPHRRRRAAHRGHRRLRRRADGAAQAALPRARALPRRGAAPGWPSARRSTPFRARRSRER